VYISEHPRGHVCPARTFNILIDRRYQSSDTVAGSGMTPDLLHPRGGSGRQEFATRIPAFMYLTDVARG
jgi:hypothetical protein